MLKGLDEAAVHVLNHPDVTDPVHLVFTWINHVATMRMKDGAMEVPPPITTRFVTFNIRCGRLVT